MKLKIGHRTFRVEPFEPDGIGDHPAGYVKNRTGVIGVDRTDPPDEQADTLVHEILHVIWNQASLPDAAPEEAAVTHLAHGICQVLRDNPDLIVILVKGLEGKKIAALSS